MNILFLSTENPFPVDHGHHIRTFHNLVSLAKDHKIYFVGFTQNKSGFENQTALYQFCETVDIFSLHYRGWLKLILVMKNIFSPLPFVAQKYFDKRAANRIEELIKKANIDLVHFDMLHLAKYKDKINFIPCILINHNVESIRILRWTNFEKNPLLKRFLQFQYKKLNRFEKEICKNFNCCIAVSKIDRDYLINLCGTGNFVTLPNGVDPDYFYKASHQTVPNSLVWTGPMNDPYNSDAVIYFLSDIWPLIIENLDKATVNFVGDSPVRILKRMTQNNYNIRYTGYVEDIRPYVAEAAVFIAPLRSGSGTKIKVLNAMAMGKTVVTTSIGAEGIEAEADKEILVADTPKLFAEKVVYLLQHPDKSEEIGRNARKMIEYKYDWKIIESKMRKLYPDVLRSYNQRKAIYKPGTKIYVEYN
jgi:glycosyltransferase involved in cell wall biosynthesis